MVMIVTFGRASLPDNSVDSVVTVPYGASIEVWIECLRVLKPGGHVLAVAKPTEYHRIAVAIEDAGFEVRDQIIWLHQTHHSIALARKPLEGTVAANVLKWNTGALNIDESRVGENPGYRYNADRNGTIFHGEQGDRAKQTSAKKGSDVIESTQGRWPANVITDGSDAVVAGFPNVKGQVGMKKTKGGHRFIVGDTETVQQFQQGVFDEGSAARFFATTPMPISLFRYLIKLVTPPNGAVLDPWGDPTIAEAISLEDMTQARDL